MNFLKIKTSWSNAELALIKICLVSFGIAVGTFFHEYMKEYLFLFFILYIVTAIAGIILWLRKMKQ